MACVGRRGREERPREGVSRFLLCVIVVLVDANILILFLSGRGVILPPSDFDHSAGAVEELRKIRRDLL